MTLKRKGRMTGDSCFVTGDVDNLSYTYASNTNQLSTVTESASMTWGFKNPTSNTTAYEYDDNGSLTEDHYKGVVTVYNHLTLPVYIAKGTDSILMMYDAGGSLLRKQHKSGSTVVMTRDYIGGIEFVNDTLDAIYHSEGRIKYIDEVARYEYYIRDHLGNIRITYSDLNADGLITTPDEIIEEMHYYPFGMMMEGSWMGSSGQYGYNGIEYESFLDLEMNLATYRGLDPTLGRWWQVDPKAEGLMSMTPYNAMANNPISFNDPEGDFIPAMLVGAAIGFATNGISNVVQGNNFFQGGLKAAAFGAIGGGVSFGIGQAAAGMSGLGKAAFQMGAHGISGGTMSAAQGGSFGSGFLSGALSSGMSSGAGSLGVGNAGMIGIGGLSGGIGSSIAGGSFWRGVGQGLITSGLNHAAHSGMFGEGLAVSLVTGELRHIAGPDAIHFTAGTQLGAAPTVSYEKGKILFLRGKNLAGKIATMNEAGAGIGLELASANVSGTNLYYSGSTNQININTFQGFRYQLSVGITIKGIEIGGNVSFANTHNNEFVLGIGKSIGFGYGYPGVLYGASGNINFGMSTIPR